MEIEVLRHGVFMATNGKDTVLAEYKRARPKQPDNIGAHWELTMNDGRVFTVLGGKEEALARTKQILTSPISQPLSLSAAKRMQEELSSVCGIVEIPGHFLFDGNNTGVKDYALNVLLEEEARRLASDVSLWAVGTTTAGGVCVRTECHLMPHPHQI